MLKGRGETSSLYAVNIKKKNVKENKMGIYIQIGELEVYSEEETDTYSSWRMGVQKARSTEALFFPGDTGVSEFSTSYTSFYNFCREADMTFTFREEVVHLTPQLLSYFQQVLDKRNTQQQPLFQPSGMEHDWVKARLEWFVYWIDWALKNCSRPAMKVS